MVAHPTGKACYVYILLSVCFLYILAEASQNTDNVFYCRLSNYMKVDSMSLAMANVRFFQKVQSEGVKNKKTIKWDELLECIFRPTAGRFWTRTQIYIKTPNQRSSYRITRWQHVLPLSHCGTKISLWKPISLLLRSESELVSKH
jgi:hypothetical protein